MVFGGEIIITLPLKQHYRCYNLIHQFYTNNRRFEEVNKCKSSFVYSMSGTKLTLAPTLHANIDDLNLLPVP